MSRRTPGPTTAVAAAALIVAASVAAPGAAAKRPAKPPTAQGTFTDLLRTFDSARWAKADGWANGSPFDNAWAADHVTFLDGLLDLRLDDTANLGQPYTSGEYRTTGFYGYGCYEVSVKPVAVPGIVTSFFTFAGPYDNGGNGRHNEIDIEFLGNGFPGGGLSYVQVNFWTNDDDDSSSNESVIQLGFDAAQDFHRYGFKWTATGIGWYVNGSQVLWSADEPGRPTPKAGDSLQKIMMNQWAVDPTAAGWAGTFIYPGQPLHAQYQWVRYTQGESCEIGDPPDDTLPPGNGDASAMHLLDVAMSLDARATQAIARVSVIDGLGQPVVGASVTGRWSGIITTGDGRRDTDANGVATFYSSRSRSAGEVTFCVTGVSKAGSTYDAAANVETCQSLLK